MKNISLFLFLILLSSCSKSSSDSETVLATITTTVSSTTTSTTTVSGGTISSEGGTTITQRGVCWSTNHNPTIMDNKTTDGTGIGTFTSIISGLTANTTYYIRAYATNSVGTAYGNEVSCITNDQAMYFPPLDGSSIWETKIINDFECFNSR